jgi:hypothetical protein
MELWSDVYCVQWWDLSVGLEEVLVWLRVSEVFV